MLHREFGRTVDYVTQVCRKVAQEANEEEGSCTPWHYAVREDIRFFLSKSEVTMIRLQKKELI